jgi:sulfatase maturation enzyme AslB (radical SAM superfamily)
MLTMAWPSSETLASQARAALEYGPQDPLRRNGVVRYAHHALRVLDASHGRGPLPSPLSIQIEITNRCNNRCAMCYRYLAEPGAPDYLKVEEVRSVCQQATALGVKSVIFSGGEPTLRGRDFEAMLRDAGASGLAIGVLTNGLSLAPTMFDTLVDEATWIRVSVDAGSNDVYEEGPGGSRRLQSRLRKPSSSTRNSEFSIECRDDWSLHDDPAGQHRRRRGLPDVDG